MHPQTLHGMWHTMLINANANHLVVVTDARVTPQLKTDSTRTHESGLVARIRP
jgi:hypothetical protein